MCIRTKYSTLHYSIQAFHKLQNICTAHPFFRGEYDSLQTAEVKRTFDKESILKQAITTLSTIFVIMLHIRIEGMRNPNKIPVGKNRSRAGRCGHSGTKRFPPSFF